MSGAFWSRVRCAGVFVSAGMCGCVRLHAPEPFELGRVPIPVAEYAGVSAEASAEISAEPAAELDTTRASVAGADLAAEAAADVDSTADADDASHHDWTRVRVCSPTDAVRGICVLMPGILGSHSSPTCENRLRGDGWHVVVVAPPLVSAVLRELRAEDAQVDLAERGARVGRAVDSVVARAAEMARDRVAALRTSDAALADKPVIFVGESLGALLGVGVVATGRVECDAAIFVAGGGSLLDVAAESSIRRFLFGDLPIDDPEFRRGFVAASRFDSLAAAGRLRGCPVVCVTAAIDIIVPTPSQEALWMALGQPPRYRFDGGHLELFLFAEWNILPAVREVASRATASLPSAP